MNNAEVTEKRKSHWQEVHRRFAQVHEATGAGSALLPERAKAIMDERARLLTRVPPQQPSAGEMLAIATFTLASERYGIEARHVREVIRQVDFTPVPGGPEFLLGLVNLRGEILAVIDLGRILGLNGVAEGRGSRIIVLGHQRAEFGILADEVHEITAVPIDQIFPAPASLAASAHEFLRGVTNDALIILDGAVLLAERRLFIEHREEGDL